MRNKIFAGIALLLGGGAIVRNLSEGGGQLADWPMPILFVLLGVYLLTKK